MGTAQQEGFNLGGVDLLSANAVTPFVYAQFNLEGGSGDIITDLSGNGHNLYWDTENNLAYDANTSGLWTVDGLAFGAVVENEVFSASNPSVFPLQNENYSSVYVARFTKTAAVALELSTIFAKRGAISGDTDGGWQWHVSNVNQKTTFLLHDGTTTIMNVPTALLTALPISEVITAMICFDASINAGYMIQASDSTIVQYDLTVTATPSDIVHSDVITSKATIGGRSQSLSGSESTNNMTMHGYRFYHDFNGGALPTNLSDICRWLHQHPHAHIPAHWWS